MRAISVDDTGNIYLAGNCYETWGSPIQPVVGSGDGFIAKLNNSGALQWNTFLGSPSKSDVIAGIVADGDDSVYIAGESQATWGAPFNPFSGWSDAFVARLNSSGVLLWNTFLGQEYNDNCHSLAADDSGSIHITGHSYGTWGTPVNPFADWSDIFVAKIHDTDFDDTTAPEVDSDSPLDGTANVPVDATISATFSEDIAPLTIDTNSFSLDNGVSGSVSYDSNNFTATFTPDTDLDFETTYTVTISTTVEDLAGNALESEYTWSFTTAPVSATVSGVPVILTAATDATLTVGGTGVVAYKYRLDTGSFSTEIPVGTTINLSGLSTGNHAVTVLGKDATENWQPEAKPTTVLWTVGPPASLAAGLYFSAALKPDGTVWTWGRNFYGQLGDGVIVHEELAHTVVPTQVPGLCDMTAIATGWEFSLATKSDGTVWAWGRNDEQQLADGTITDRSTPAQISGIDDVVAVAAGEHHGLALESDGTVRTWGWNVHGQVGDGTTVTRLVSVATPLDLSTITATISGVPPNPTNSTGANLTVAGSGVVSYKYKLDAGSYSNEVAIGNIISLTSLAEGPHTVSVIGKNFCGKWQQEIDATTVSWTIDTTASSATITGTPSSPTNSTSASLTIAGTDIVSYKFQQDGGSWSSEIAVGTPISLTGLSEGLQAISVTGKDSAGNWQDSGDATTVSWTIDTTSPIGVSVVNEGDEYANATSVSINLNSNDAQQVCFSNDGTIYSNWEAMTQNKSWVLSEGEGEKTVSIKYKDAAGNTYVSTDSITLDTVPPDAPVPNPADESFENIPTLDWEVSAGCASYILEYDTDVNFSTATRVEDILPSDYTPDSMLSDGQWYWRVRAVDAAGNMSGWSTTEELTINTSGYCDDDPQRPQLLLPADGDLNVSRTPVLTTSVFLGPSHCGLHWKTRWQISERADFHGLTLNANTFENLDRYEVTKSVLKPNTTYYWRVRYWGTYGNKSEWSEIFSFTTEAAIEDIDDNGIVDDEEVDPGVDLDNDGTEDRNQTNEIKSVKSCRGELMVGIRPSRGTIVRADVVDDMDIEGHDGKPTRIPYGLFAYRIELSEYGQTVNVDLHLSKPAPQNAYWAMFDPVNGWYDYSAHTVFNASRSKITIQLKDGGFGDCDHTENGVIVDPGGLAIVDESTGGGGCFISITRTNHGLSQLNLWVICLGLCLITTGMLFYRRLVIGEK